MKNQDSILFVTKTQDKIVKKFNYTLTEVKKIWIFCPNCFHKESNRDDNFCGFEDYCENNVWWHCNECWAEYILCERADSMNTEYHDSDFRECACLKKMTESQVLSYVNERGFLQNFTSFLNNQQNSSLHFYKVGLVKLTEVYSHNDTNKKRFVDLTTNKKLPIDQRYAKVDPPISNLNEIPFDTNHGGIYLYFKGFCSCNDAVCGKIWGC